MRADKAEVLAIALDAIDEAVGVHGATDHSVASVTDTARFAPPSAAMSALACAGTS
jgi:hypothetical protein